MIVDDWLKDIPQQFLDKRNIEILVSAFAKQIQELYKVYSDLNLLTDLETAFGVNLDYVGTIIPMSRKDASEIAGVKEHDYIMEDKLYRKYLKYKNLVNTSECTYYDIIEGLKLLLGDDAKISYVEKKEYPATIFIRLPVFSKTEQSILSVPIVRAAGVGVVVELDLNANRLYIASAFLSGETVSIYPLELENIDVNFTVRNGLAQAIGSEIVEIGAKE